MRFLVVSSDLVKVCGYVCTHITTLFVRFKLMTRQKHEQYSKQFVAELLEEQGDAQI